MKTIALALVLNIFPLLLRAQNPAPGYPVKGWHLSLASGCRFNISPLKANVLTDPLVAMPRAQWMIQGEISWYPGERWGTFIQVRQGQSYYYHPEDFKAALLKIYPGRYVESSKKPDFQNGISQALFGIRLNRTFKKINYQPGIALGITGFSVTDENGTVKTPDSHELLHISAQNNYVTSAFTAALNGALRIPLSKRWWLSVGLDAQILVSSKLAYRLTTTDQVTQQTQTQDISYSKPFFVGNAFIGINVRL